MDKTVLKKKKTKLRIKPGPATWILLFVLSVLLSIYIFRFPLLPKKWKWAVIGLIILVDLTLYFFSFRKTRKRTNRSGVSIVNILLSICMLFGSLFLPGFIGRIEDIFVDMPETAEVVINVYALKTEYKAAHSEQFRTKGVSMITDTDLMNYKNKQFITQNAVDQDNQAWALGQIRELFGTDSLWENNTSSVWAAVNALYSADGDALVLNAAYAELIADEGAYSSFEEDTIILKTFRRNVDGKASKKKVAADEPFAILIAGSDSRSAALSPVTRTDVDILAAVNPGEKTILLVSLPRDTYMANPALDNALDKLTHMGVYGIENATDALGQFFSFDLDKYILVNFNTYSRIVNTLGGVDVVNPYAFNGGKYAFPAGRIHLSGDEALAYVRERKSLPNGDFDRNEHQVLVLRALLRKMLSLEVLTNFSTVLDSLNGTFLTNMATESIFDIVSAQLDSIGSWKINSRHVDGSTGLAECASMPGQLLSVVYSDQDVVKTIRDEMISVLEIEKTKEQKE